MTRSLSSQTLAGLESLNSGQDFPKIEYNQPLSSPYDHPMITIRIGEKEYLILGSHIRKYPLLGYSSPQKTYITLSDIQEDVGHTLVHFLYSGTYETINSPLDVNTSHIEREYQRSVLIYHASRKYHITDLEILARKYIEHFGEAISTFEILRSTRETFSKLPEDEAWLPGYVRNVLQRSFVSGNARFNIDDLSGILKGCDSFSRAIMLSVIEILSSHIQYSEKGTSSQPHFASGVSADRLTSTEDVVAIGECPGPEEPPAAPEDPPYPDDYPAALDDPPAAPEDPPYPDDYPAALDDPPAAPEDPPYPDDHPASLDDPPAIPEDLPYPDDPPAVPEDLPYPDDHPAALDDPPAVPEDLPYPDDHPAAPEDPPTELHVKKDATTADLVDSKGNLVKRLLPDMTLYHDWETLSPGTRRRRSSKLKRRNLPIPNADGAISISLI